VGKYEELRLRILQGKSDANINFDDLWTCFIGWGSMNGRAAATTFSEDRLSGN